jgi:hypothetical protein
VKRTLSAQPVLGYDVQLDGPNGWYEANRYLIWSGRWAPDAPSVALAERLESGPVTLPLRKRSLSLVPANTPHRLTHLFGFWRTSDADLLVFRMEMPAANHVCLYISSGPEHAADRLYWYCERCGKVLKQWDHDVQRFGARAFWDRALEQIRAFNADAAARTCSTCGTTHSAAYGIDAELDTDEERQARAIW